jgi:hypothetical protein
LSIDGNPTQINLSKKIIRDVDRDYLKENISVFIKKIFRNYIPEKGYEDYIYNSTARLLQELELKKIWIIL